MKKRVLNIKPQEVTTDGHTSVRYKGSDGKMHSLASSMNENGMGEPIAASPATAQSNIVLEYNFADEGKTITAEELVAIIQGIMSGKSLVCITDNNWGTQNERRIAFLNRVRGFEVVDGNVMLGDTLTFDFPNPTDYDLYQLTFLKQQDGSYQYSHEYNK